MRACCGRRVPLREAGGGGPWFWLRGFVTAVFAPRAPVAHVGCRPGFWRGWRFFFYCRCCRLCHYRHIHRLRHRRRPGSFSPIAFAFRLRSVWLTAFRIQLFFNQLSTFNFQLFFNQSFIPFLRRFLPRLASDPFSTFPTIHSVDRPRAGFDHGR